MLNLESSVVRVSAVKEKIVERKRGHRGGVAAPSEAGRKCVIPVKNADLPSHMRQRRSFDSLCDPILIGSVRSCNWGDQ